MAVLRNVCTSLLCQRVAPLTHLNQEGAHAVDSSTTSVVMPSISTLIRLRRMRITIFALEALKLRTCRAWRSMQQLKAL